MCVILVGKIGLQLHDTAKTINSHGFSCFTKSLGLVKAPTDKQVKQAVSEFGIWHYRIASSGKVDKENIHPFPVAHGKAYLYHNGVLGRGTDILSDTNCLARTLYDCSMESVHSTLQALADGQRFLLVQANDPMNFRLYGKWHVHKGVLMSNQACINSYSTRSYSLAERAGWVTRDESCYPNLRTYKDYYGEEGDVE